MAKKPVNLTVHRNTLEQRRARQVSRDLVSDAKALAAIQGLSGFVILAWDDEWVSHASWDQGSLPSGLLPVLAREILSRHLGVRDAQTVVTDALKGSDGD